VIYRRDFPDSLSAVVASRLELKGWIPDGGKIATRLAKIESGGPRLEVLEMWDPASDEVRNSFEGWFPFFADRVNFDERLLAAYLSLLAQGQISPRRMRPSKGNAAARAPRAA
jgi:hypothetical protein